MSAVHVPYGFRDLSDPDQKDGLPHASEAEKHHTLRVASSLNSSQGDIGRFEELVATGQGRGPRSCSRCEWVSDWIHGTLREG